MNKNHEMKKIQRRIAYSRKLDALRGEFRKWSLEKADELYAIHAPARAEKYLKDGSAICLARLCHEYNVHPNGVKQICEDFSIPEWEVYNAWVRNG